jgi:hypothetical protein
MTPREAIALAAVLILACIALIAVLKHERYEARHAFPDPDGDADPDGEQFAGRLRGGTPPPLPAAGRLPELPPVPAPRLDDTGEIPHAVGTWGKTPAQITDELAARYLT